MAIRFCTYQYQHLPLSELEQRWMLAEELGFDVLWNADTVVEPDHPQSIMFDGPPRSPSMAVKTTDPDRDARHEPVLPGAPVTAAKAA